MQLPAAPRQEIRLFPKETAEFNARRHEERAAASSAPRQEIRLFPKETRPFNYVRLNEEDAPHLHTSSSKEQNEGDNERT